MPPPLSRLRALLRFRSDRRGATAVEFALIAAPFFFLLLVVVELGMIYILTTTLDAATQEASRTIRTGQTQSATASAANFRDMVCDRMGWLQDQCSSHLSVDVRTFSSFSGQNAPNPATGSTFDPTQLVFNTGAPGQIILVRSFYQWNLITPLMFGALETFPGSGVTVITSASTFRNEPF